MRQITLYISGYTDRNIQGLFYASEYGIVTEFHNLTQLLFLMDDLLENANPAAGGHFFWWKSRHRSRNLLKNREREKETLATFEITRFTRKGHSWQGNIHWKETGETLMFRSALELIKILDNALME
jgi:hypothetical protein